MKKTNDTPMEDFQALYNRQVNRVYRLALVMLGSQSDAEDMVQMVFLKVWEKKISFRDTDHETAWILTATKNQCKDVLKSYERKHCGTLEEMPEPGIASENHMENVVWLALESLEPKYRILLYLYYYEGYSIRELTAILKRKESTLQTQLAAGRRKLKEELKKQGRFHKIGKGRENKMMSDPEKWEEIFKYTIDQTSPDQERKEQMWNRLQSTISGRGQKRKQVIRFGWQPHGRKNICSGIGRNLCDCSLPVDRRRCQCRNGWCIIGFYPGILRTSGTAEENGRRRIEAEKMKCMHRNWQDVLKNMWYLPMNAH